MAKFSEPSSVAGAACEVGRVWLSRLPMFGIHDLRPIHATTLLLTGVPVRVVAARLGHADLAITFRVYAHVVRSVEVTADAIARVGSGAA